ncbi:hypothetical protein L6472_00240 [Prevotella sp. E13-17]|uniref:hypothetical protein n=1 Tax=Prevotella sp. E13-17 TaxID=2913616 RepID=UPI001EDAA4C8|nr:hypothetical protein [Prevotella sp. E13-17]UKK51063.1 hypothetical protein L6472_00240 [Prevotella sp. E13-17]
MMKSLLTTFLLAACALSASASDYYVSPAGAGTKDGSSWENAWSIDELQTNFNSTNASSFANGDNVYFAGGTYMPTSSLYVKMGINLIGSEGAERTVFNGDANGDGDVNDGDRDRVFQINTAVAAGTTDKCVSITNIDFEGLYIAQGGNDTKGAIYLDNCGALVTVSKCNFKNLINSGQGANAFFSKRSSLKVVDCIFTNNKAANRGVVARLQSDNKTKGWTTFEHCLFANNETTGATNDPCGLVMMQHGQELTLNSCTFVDNTIKGNGASIYNATEPNATYARVLNVTNCLFYNNTSADNQNVLGNSVSTVTNSVVHDDATSAAINITSVGVGTYYLGLPFTMPAGLMGKTFSSDNAGVLTIGETYTAGDIVPAGTALLVEGTEGVYDPVVAVSDEAAPTNLLKGSDVAETTTGDGKHYKLANGESGLGFYYAEAGGAAFMNKAHRAYLVLGGSEARSFVSFENEAASVKGLQNSGTKRSGKFIENGRIVMMKNGIKYNVVGQKL